MILLDPVWVASEECIILYGCDGTRIEEGCFLKVKYILRSFSHIGIVYILTSSIKFRIKYPKWTISQVQGSVSLEHPGDLIEFYFRKIAKDLCYE
jgi:hypothetical protein